MKNMTGGQLTQIYNIATQQGCGQDEVQYLIESGYMADFFARDWQNVNRIDFRKLGHLAPEDFVVSAYLRNLGITLTVPAQQERNTVNCFTDTSMFAYRDNDFDSWLPKTLPESPEVKVSGVELTKVTTEAELAKLGNPLTNLSQIENLILRTDWGENTGLLTNGYANIFFLEVGTSVFAVYAHRRSGGWRVSLHRFSARSEWYAGGRFFSLAT